MMYLKRGGKVVGPFTDEKIRDGLRGGQLRNEDLAAASPSGPWKSLGSIFLLKRVERPQSSSSADDREPSELWILCKDVWKGIATRRKERQEERKAIRVKAQPKARQSDGLFSPTLAFLLIGALGIAAFAYFGLAGSGLEQSFIDQIFNPIRDRARKNTTFVNEHSGVFTGGPDIGKPFVIWRKKKYEAEFSYDIEKTSSLVSPYVAQIDLKLREFSEDINRSDPLGDGYYRTRESVIAAGWDEDVVAANTRAANPYTFIYRNGQWTYAPTEYQKKWFGEEQPGPWPILDRKLSEETWPDWRPFVE
jgi:hypothetical protein